MKEHPMLFSTPMVQAIMEDRKTQTRRIVKPQPQEYEAKGKRMYSYSDKKNFIQSDFEFIADNFLGIPKRWQVGDLIWVKETFLELVPEHFITTKFVYKANCDSHSEEIRQEYIKAKYPYKWKPSIFMPKAAARIWLEITNIKVERLQDISEEDAIKEGIEDLTNGKKLSFRDYLNNKHPLTAIASFKSLWQSINGKESWNANPFCWVIEFKCIQK
jgi:hypothetical protein